MDAALIPTQKQMTGMLGHPVAENPIDRMFDAVYAHYGLPWQFWKNNIASEADLALAVKALAPLGYRGMAITVPYKVAVMPLLDAVDDDVRAIGAANYLTIDQAAPLTGQRVVMLGAGGAGGRWRWRWPGPALPISPLLLAGRTRARRWRPQLVTRTSGVPAVWQHWQGEVLVPAGTTLLMNATHLGCAPEQEPVPVRWETVDPACVVVDVITNPRITPFLSTAQERGCPIVDGVEMLVQLAMQIFQRWTGLSPDEEVFQRAVAAHFPAISPPTTAIPVSIRWIGGAPRPCCQRVKTDQ